MLPSKEKNTYIIHTGAPVAAAPVAEAFDPWEIMDPVEILSKLPKDFFEQVRGHFEHFFVGYGSLMTTRKKRISDNLKKF